MRLVVTIACSLILLAPLAFADDLGMEGDKLVEPNCDAMSSWFECRDIDTAPADVRRGYEYMHNTSSTLGPFGAVTYPDGAPYATAATACSTGRSRYFCSIGRANCCCSNAASRNHCGRCTGRIAAAATRVSAKISKPR